MLSVANARKNSSDFRPSMPFATPAQQRRPDLGSGLLHVVLGALGVVDAEVRRASPGSCPAPGSASPRCRPSWRRCRRTTSRKMSTPIATSPSRTRIAPPIRGTRWRSSQPTAGPATAPSTAARMTGMTIVDVWPGSQMTPRMISTKPTSSHDEKPRFLSHPGADALRGRHPTLLSDHAWRGQRSSEAERAIASSSWHERSRAGARHGSSRSSAASTS